MAIDLKDTQTLMQAMERIKAPASFLVDTFFPNKPPVATTRHITVETRQKGRKLAPFITRNSKGVDQTYVGSKVATYEPPKVGPSMVISPDMLEDRGFGETIYSTITPAERAMRMQSEMLTDLQAMIMNRKNKMAADILTTGKCIIEGYADDAGQLAVTDTVDFGWTQNITPSTTWDQAGADILGDLRGASFQIQESAGFVPTTLVVGKNVFEYILSNDAILKYLAIPNRENLQMFNFAPRIEQPQIMYGGRIASLGIDIYTYAETYTNEKGEVVPFLHEDGAILAAPGRGRQLHSAITLLNDDGRSYSTYAGEYVPYVYGDKETQQMRLAMYSSFLLAPEFSDDWAYIKTK